MAGVATGGDSIRYIGVSVVDSIGSIASCGGGFVVGSVAFSYVAGYNVGFSDR